MLVVVSIGTFTFCSLEYMRIHKSSDKFKNMQSFGVYGFDPEVSAAPVNQETVKVDPTPEPLMKSVEPQLSTSDNSDKKTEENEDHYSK